MPPTGSSAWMPAWTITWPNRSPTRCSGRCFGAGCPSASSSAGVAMPRRLTNLVLLAAAVGLAGSGLLGWIVPDRVAGPWYELHHLFGALLVLTLLWKAPIVR